MQPIHLTRLTLDAACSNWATGTTLHCRYGEYFHHPRHLRAECWCPSLSHILNKPQQFMQLDTDIDFLKPY